MSEILFTEAPASAAVKISHRGFSDILFTLRASSGAELLTKLDAAIDHFEKKGITPAAHRNGASQTNGNGTTPMCSIHQKPMKASKHGGYFCPVKIADDDGAGKPVYCKQKAK